MCIVLKRAGSKDERPNFFGYGEGCFDRLSNRHTVVAAIGGIAAAAPGVVAQAHHAAAGSVGNEAALVVGEGVCFHSLVF